MVTASPRLTLFGVSALVLVTLTCLIVYDFQSLQSVRTIIAYELFRYVDSIYDIDRLRSLQTHLAML